MTTARYSTFTTNSINCYAIVADLLACNVQYLGTSKNLQEAGKYGINGPFYDQAGSGTLYGIAASTGGVAVHTAGDGNSGYNRGTMICYSPSGTPYIYLARPKLLSDVGLSNINWAIGGISMNLSNTFSGAQAYIDDLKNSNEHPEGVVGFDASTTSTYHRSAIGYRASDNKIIMLATSEATVWNVRDIMKTYIGCDQAIFLDGNPSTELRAKNSSGVDQYPISNYDRTCAYVTVSPTSWT
jgi:hypothetical protein